MIDRRLYLKSLQTVFDKNQQFRDITRQTKQLTMAKEVIDRSLPAPLSRHALSHSYKDSRLIISLPNSTLLSQMRFYIPELLNIFRATEEFSTLKKIHLKVVATTAKSQVQKRTLSPLSKRNALMLTETADTMEEGPLKRALMKLAKNTKG